MSLRLIARDLYRLQQKVDRCKEALARCVPKERAKLKRKLAKAMADRDQLKRLLDGRLDR